MLPVNFHLVFLRDIKFSRIQNDGMTHSNKSSMVINYQKICSFIVGCLKKGLSSYNIGLYNQYW